MKGSGSEVTLERTRMSAPASIRAFTISGRLLAAAHIRAVCPFCDSFALTSAPRASSDFTASVLPVLAQVISGVSRDHRAAFGFARASSRRTARAEFPFEQAWERGVTP